MTIDIEPINQRDVRRKRKEWGRKLSTKEQAKMNEAIRKYRKMTEKPDEYYNSER